jgi:replicative superfamily II helicase
MLADPGRGPPLELALAKALCCCRDPGVQLLGMSATMGGAQHARLP